MYETILYSTEGPNSQEGQIATITLNRPDELNTIVPPMPDEVEHAVATATRDPDVKVIDIMRSGYDDIEAFLDEVSECEHVISTSLHGLIVAQAYGIPVGWAVMSTREPS